MNDLIKSIENSIPNEIILKLKKILNKSNPMFVDFSKNLRRLVMSNELLKKELFKENSLAIYYCGEILCDVFYDFWHSEKRELNEIFIESVEKYAKVYDFDWEKPK